MVLCKSYQGGCCNNVFRCPNEHVNVKDIIERDINEAVNGKQWPLSSYGPFFNKPSLPNFIEDKSFEEVRMSFYETKLKNFFGKNYEEYNKDVQEARNKMKVTVDIVNVAIILYDTTVGAEEKNTSLVKCSSGVTIPNTSFNNPFGVEQFTSATTNSNDVFGLPKFVSNYYRPSIKPATNIRTDISFAHCPTTNSKPNNTNNPFGITNTTSATASLTLEPPFKYINNSFGIANSAIASYKHDPSSMESQLNNTNNAFVIANSASANSKPLPSINFNNLLEKETLGGGSSQNLYGKENVFGVQSNSGLSTFNNTNNPSGIASLGSATSNTIQTQPLGFSPFGRPYNNTNQFIFRWTDDHYIAKQIDKSIMDLILVHMLPCSIVDSAAFQRLKFADPTIESRYKQKSEEFFSDTFMPDTYNKVKEKVMTMITTTKWISLTIDKWRSPHNSNELVTFTAHFLLGFLRKKLVLAAKVMENEQIDPYIIEELPEIIKSFKLEEKLHITVCDNVHKMETAKIKAFECVAHNMQLVVHDVIFNKKQVQEILAKCRNIAKHFEISQQASEYFENMQEKYLLEKQCLIQDVETNWSSSYLMIKRFMEQKMAVSLYSEEKSDIENLTTEEWDQLKNIVDALESIYEATTDISADTATISLIIPLIEMLQSTLNGTDDADQLQNYLKAALNEKFKFIETSPLLIMSTLLDPRFKNKYLSETQMSIAEKEISNFLQMDTANYSKTCNKSDQRKSNNTLWEKHDVTIETDVSLNELSLYLQEPLSLRNSDIYKYWNTSRYEKLKKVAEKYLSVPPTIVASEQMLGAAGRLYADRKVDLKEVNVEELLFCHFNIQFLEFDY
ncbi:zinc finger BED domain-containing protein 4-like [Lucilia sericata]|uniref:zinc finger BED domain-containing protein 4-like n=1 Tax=Lucilia sericata TaxID=13632 RepID=UPI0018A82132|nr:zinc finger BED domain-containing protein 4-like [Lucilia sericata]